MTSTQESTSAASASPAQRALDSLKQPLFRAPVDEHSQGSNARETSWTDIARSQAGIQLYSD
ncbi:MAG TPA: hypothetical protein VN081_03605 [Dongiaceae bacterium]|nr:hypothetical protein [Dongiaceae bacterium]